MTYTNHKNVFGDKAFNNSKTYKNPYKRKQNILMDKHLLKF